MRIFERRRDRKGREDGMEWDFMLARIFVSLLVKRIHHIQVLVLLLIFRIIIKIILQYSIVYHNIYSIYV